MNDNGTSNFHRFHSGPEIEKNGHFLKHWPNDLKFSGFVEGTNIT